MPVAIEAPEALVVDFLGTGGSAPSAARAPLALRVAFDGGALLVDCGESCGRQLLLAGHDPAEIDVCLLTHPHADHYLGLGGLLALAAERGRSTPLRIIGPRGLEAVVGAFLRGCGPLPFELELTTLGGGRELGLDGVDVRAFAVSHVGPAFGYAFSLGRRTALVVNGDTRPCATTRELAQGALLLVHESTFCRDEQDRAEETRHSTAVEAAELARRARVETLALVHLSSRHPPSQALREARAVFPKTKLPRDLDRVRITAGTAEFSTSRSDRSVRPDRDEAPAPAPGRAPDGRSGRRPARRSTPAPP